MNGYYEQIIKKEGNRREFSYRGYDAIILRIRPEISGHLCGYVRMRGELSDIHYDDLNRRGIEVHGGLTFSGNMDGEKGFWIGFDCAHSGDLSPAYDSDYIEMFSEHGYTYKDMDYVEKELMHLIDQLKSLKGASSRIDMLLLGTDYKVLDAMIEYQNSVVFMTFNILDQSNEGRGMTLTLSDAVYESISKDQLISTIKNEFRKDI